MIFYTDISNLEIDKLNYKSSASYVGHLLLKYALKRYGVKIEKHEISYGKYGKPYITDIKYHFNISHSNNLVYVIIGKNECGIDVEMVDETKDMDKIINKFFPHQHAELCACLDDDLKREYFYIFWTMMEANAKKEGISILKYRNENFKPIDNFFVKDKLGNQYCLAYTLENQKRVKIEFNELNTI